MILKDITGFPALTGILCFCALAEGLTENNYESLDFYKRKYIWKPKNKK
jgi:hypothetical protein